MKQDNFQLGQVVGEIKGIRADISEIKEFIKDYDKRLIEIENWRSQVYGVVIGVSTVISVLITIFGAFIQKVIAQTFK